MTRPIFRISIADLYRFSSPLRAVLLVYRSADSPVYRYPANEFYTSEVLFTTAEGIAGGKQSRIYINRDSVEARPWIVG